MTYSRAAVILVSVAFALARLLGERSEAFQAFAHGFVFVLGYVAYSQVWFNRWLGRRAFWMTHVFAAWLFWLLCLVELYAAFHIQVGGAIHRALETAGVEL